MKSEAIEKLDEDWAMSVIESLDKQETKLLGDKRATADYWNGGDGWGSISGFKDAHEWVTRQLAKYLLSRIKSKLE